jgi:hypothetical protein
MGNDVEGVAKPVSEDFFILLVFSCLHDCIIGNLKYEKAK